MKVSIEITMLTVFILSLFSSCDQKKIDLKEQVEKLNNACPVNLGDIMTINSVMYDDNTVEMKFSANENVASISALNNHKGEAKEILSMSLSKESSKNLVDKIIEADAILRTVIIGSQSGSRMQVELSAVELKNAQEKFANMTEGQKLITSSVLGVKIKLPLRIDEITLMTGISITPSALVYKYEVNDYETGKDIGQISGTMKNITMSQMAAQISQTGFMGERNRQFYQALINCGQGVRVDYNEKMTGNSTSFFISLNELKDILSGKYQNNAPSIEEWNNLSNALEDLEDYTAPDTVWDY